jgi:hypothetical protein
MLKVFHTAYLRTRPFRLNVSLYKVSNLCTLFVLSCISLRWPPFARSPLLLRHRDSLFQCHLYKFKNYMFCTFAINSQKRIALSFSTVTWFLGAHILQSWVELSLERKCLSGFSFVGGALWWYDRLSNKSNRLTGQGFLEHLQWSTRLDTGCSAKKNTTD